MSDNNWKQVQKKTFTKWFNSKLQLGGYKPLADLFEDLIDGTNLIHLLEVIGNESLGKFYKIPNSSRDIFLLIFGRQDVGPTNPKTCIVPLPT